MDAHINTHICCVHISTYYFVCIYFGAMGCAHIYVRSREAISSSGPSMGGLNRPQEGVPLSDKRLFFVFEKCWFSVPIFDLHSDCNLVRQHRRLSICEYWLSWTNTETAAATPPTVMQNLLKASAQWLMLESAIFWLISPPTWVN